MSKVLILSTLVLLPRARPPHDQRLALSTSLSSSVKHRSSVPVGVHHPSSSSIIVSTSHSHSRVQVQVIGNVETVEKNMLPKASPVKRRENTPKGLNCQRNILNSNNVLQNAPQNRDLVDKWLTKTKRELSVIQYESTT